MRGAKASKLCSLILATRFIHCHVKFYPTKLLPQIPHIGLLNGSTITGRCQSIRAHNKVSSTIANKCGVLQGAVLPPFFFTLHTSDLFSESLVSFFKYADDVAIGHHCRDAQGLCNINNALKYVSEWHDGQRQMNEAGKCIRENSALRTKFRGGVRVQGESEWRKC